MPGWHRMHARVPPCCVFRYCCVLLCPIPCFSIFVIDRFEAIFALCTERTFTQATEGLWKTRALGGRDMGIPPFKMPTLHKGMLRAEESTRDGYRPKMLLYMLNKLFYVCSQIKNSHRDDKVVLAYEILCISSNRCTDQCNRIEKMGISDALALLNIEDTRHLEHLAWAVYDGALLSGARAWCAMLAGLQRHIYRGRDDVAHYLPQMLGSWDHEEWVETLHHVGGLSGRRRTSQPQRRSKSSSRQHS